MRFRVIAGLFLIIGGLVAAMKNFIALVLAVAIIGIGAIIIIRFLADIFWWGRDNGKW